MIRNLERLSGRKGDPGELGLWLVWVARVVIRLEHRWRAALATNRNTIGDAYSPPAS